MCKAQVLRMECLLDIQTQLDVSSLVSGQGGEGRLRLEMWMWKTVYENLRLDDITQMFPGGNGKELKRKTLQFCKGRGMNRNLQRKLNKSGL